MGQFEIVEVVFNSDSPVRKEDLITKIDLHSSSIEAGIKDCLQKGYIQKTERGYVTAEGFDERKLESIRPKTIEDMIGNE